MSSVFRDTVRIGGAALAISEIRFVERRIGGAWQPLWSYADTLTGTDADTAAYTGASLSASVGPILFLIPYPFTTIPPPIVGGLSVSRRRATSELAATARVLLYPPGLNAIVLDVGPNYRSGHGYRGFAVGALLTPEGDTHMIPTIAIRAGKFPERAGVRYEIRGDAFVREGAVMLVSITFGPDRGWRR